jgi:hypothetical protein
MGRGGMLPPMGPVIGVPAGFIWIMLIGTAFFIICWAAH